MKLGSLALSLVVLSGVGFAVACGDSDQEKAAAAAAKTEAQLQDEFLDTYCQIILPCCNKILQKPIADVAGCKTRIMALDPVTVKNVDGRTACITQAKAAAPDPRFCSDFAQAMTPACPDASRAKLTGMVKVGEVCNKAEDCAPDFTGIVQCNGVCQIRKHGAEGDGPCDQTVDGDVVTSLPQPAEGGTVVTCYLSSESHLQCDAETKTCIKALEDRAKCTDSSQCEKAQYCDTDEKRCFNKQTKDSKCNVNAECQGHCKIEDEDKGGFCVDKVGADEDCEDPSFCTDGLDCVSGKCTMPGPDARLAATCGG